MKSSDNGEQCEEKESNRQRSHVSFDHFSPVRCRPPPLSPSRISDDKGVNPYLAPPPSGLSLRVVSRSPPIPLSVHTFLFRLLFSLSRCFSWFRKHTRGARTQVRTGRREPMDSHSEENLLTTTFWCYPCESL